MMTHLNQTLEENEESNSVYAMYEVLKELCLNNAEFFKTDESPTGKKLCETFESLHNNVISIYPLVDELRKAAPHYDFNQNTPGNGYRSFVTVVDAFILFGEKICQQICKSRSSYFFRKSTYLREVETCSQALSSLVVILTHLKTLISWSDPGCLFPKDERSPQELLNDSPGFNQICFYGSCLGFQFCESMQVILKGLSILMVSFSEVYYSDGGMLERATNYLWHSSKYVLNPELRARRIVNISQFASVDFCKQFWFLGENELMNRLPNFVHPAVEVNRMISILPEPLSSPRADGFLVDIPIPSSHTGPSALSVRLLSAVRRQHMVGEAGGKDSLVPPSKGLIFHCHGGGFVAQSSRSHEAYLRQWAQGLPAPILSVDYSLAPEAPFPRALEDALYAYCWALNHTTLLGTTAERVIFAGDSAGANLVIGLTMKCIELGLRPPDGLFLAYVPVLVSFVPSPGRLLCLMDPLLPFGFLMGCLKAYACPPNVYAASNAHENKLRRKKKPKDNSLDTKSRSSSEESFEEISPTELLELDKILGPNNVREDNRESASEPIGSPEREGGGPVLKDEPALFELPQDAVSPGLPNRITRAAGNITTAITGTISSLASRSRSPTNDVTDSVIEDDPLLETMMLPCPMDMLKFDVPHDPYLSPYWASDVVLSQFPPVHLVTLQMDPCLDDCVEFAKKLKRLGNPVSLDIIDGLPHGFLNFVMLSKEAYEASKKCIQRLADLLALDTNSNS